MRSQISPNRSRIQLNRTAESGNELKLQKNEKQILYRFRSITYRQNSSVIDDKSGQSEAFFKKSKSRTKKHHLAANALQKLQKTQRKKQSRIHFTAISRSVFTEACSLTNFSGKRTNNNRNHLRSTCFE